MITRATNKIADVGCIVRKKTSENDANTWKNQPNEL